MEKILLWSRQQWKQFYCSLGSNGNNFIVVWAAMETILQSVQQRKQFYCGVGSNGNNFIVV